MRKIIINGRFLVHRITGVERYAREILAELDKVIHCGEFEIAIPPEVQEIPDYKNIKVVRVGGMHNRLWEHLSFPVYVWKEKGISLNLCNVAPLVSPGMVAIFDMKVRAHPEFFSKKFLLWYRLLFANEIRRARSIFTDSKAAKQDILKYYNVSAEKIIVAPCGWQHYARIQFDEHALEKYQLKKGEYFFAMGSFDPNKNFKWIAEAARNNPEVQFAVAGAINRTVFAAGLGFDCPENMKLLGYVSDEEAKALMRDCKAFLFPSICEGFGIPPLEALSAGANAVVVSDIPVMHEIFGNAAVYIDPDSCASIIEVRDVCDQDRKIILEKYSWEYTASVIRDTILRMV